MTLLYPIVFAIVTCLLLSMPAFPFWKFWKRLKTRHYNLFMSRGPFDVITLMSFNGAHRSFAKVIEQAAAPAIREKDPELHRWAVVCHGILRGLPRGFGKQILWIFTFLLLIIIFSGFIIGIIGKLA